MVPFTPQLQEKGNAGEDKNRVNIIWHHKRTTFLLGTYGKNKHI